MLVAIQERRGEDGLASSAGCAALSCRNSVLAPIRARLHCASERGQAAVEYVGTLVLVATVIAMLTLAWGAGGPRGYLESEIQHELCLLNIGSLGGSCPSPGAPATSGARAAGNSLSQADIRQAETKALGSTRLVDACAGGPGATSLAADRAPSSAACKQALARLSPHDLAMLAVVAATLQAREPDNRGKFALLLQAYLHDPAYAVIALSPRAQREQAAGNNFLARLQANGGDLWDGLLGSLCGGYGVCLGGDVLSQSYQQAYHASASLARITTPVVIATGVAGVLKDLALPGSRAVLVRLGATSSDAERAEQAIKELEGGAVGPSAAGRTSAQGTGVGAAGSGRGGIGPVLNGQAGVQRAIGELRAQGYSIEGQEVTIQTPVGRTRVDIVARDPNGNIIFEVTNGAGAAHE